jgi:hypothetical protein
VVKPRESQVIYRDDQLARRNVSHDIRNRNNCIFFSLPNV